jgi:hypothetical protein
MIRVRPLAKRALAVSGNGVRISRGSFIDSQ